VFEGKNVVITGAASGIGLGLARALAARGSSVTLADLNLAGAQAGAEAIARAGGKARAVQVDVADADAVERLMASVEPLDYAFNNAGYAILGEARDLPYAQWHKLVQVNLLGVIAGSLAAYRHMTRQGHGHIVNTASLAGLAGSPLLNAYSTTKSAVIMFSRMLRAEGEALGVKVSAICPSFIRTGIFDAAHYAAADKEEMLKQIPFPVMPLEPALELIIAGVERNEALIVFPFHARLLWRLLRWFPGLGRPLERKALAQFRRIRKAS
jgi:NAD(P)-dependent dehydrogenase (short-subunit alcohol dehydrogenase family)